MTLTILGSGSEGNATLLCSDHCNLLIDCGLNAGELKARMAPLPPYKTDAILCTHSHGDHIRGIDALLKTGLRYGRVIPIYVSSLAVRDVIMSKLSNEHPPFAFFEPGLPFSISDIRIDPFTTMHDCVDGTVAFKFTVGDTKIGYAIDLGFIPPAMPKKFADCNVIVIESNHDVAMLETCSHPQSVKDRVAGRGGHLSNDQAAEFLAGTNGSLRKVCLAHLSKSSNTPQLALSAAQAALDWAGSKAEVMVASQHQPTRIL